MRVGYTLQNLNRLREVIGVLLKYGFDEFVAGTPLRGLMPQKAQDVTKSVSAPLPTNRYERLRMVVEELGPTFIKLAQVLSNRPDLLPEALIEEFEKLQSNVPPMGFAEVQAIVEQEWGKPIKEVCSYFDKQVLGAASIGQVHRAKLHTGEDVVVKVQRADAKRQVYTDLALLRELVRLTEAYFVRLGILNPLAVIDTFERVMQAELDYRQEIRNIELFRHTYRHETWLQIPKPYTAYSTERVLVLEFVSGCKITDLPQLEAWGLDARRIVERGMSIYLTQIFEVGLFHADPHPGNILVRPTGHLALIDFGMVGRLSKYQKYAFAGMLVALANQDSRTMAINLRRLALESEIGNMQTFENDLQALIENFIVFNPNPEAGIGDFTTELQKVIHQYRLQVPGEIFLILRALAMLEGIGRVLYPKFETLEFIKPYGLKLLTEQFSFKNQRAELSYSLSQLLSLLYVLPGEVNNLLRQAREGDFHVRYTLTHGEMLPRQLRRVGNQLTLSLLIICLMAASIALMFTPFAMQMPRWGGIPVWSALGMGISLGLVAWLGIYSWRHR